MEYKHNFLKAPTAAARPI